MADTHNKNELYTTAQNNFKRLLEVALSSEISSGQPLDDPEILQKLQEMTNAINEPSSNCYLVPQFMRDCSEGNYESVKEHINNGCDVNEIGHDGETALVCAINANSYKIVELLLKTGADPNLRADKVESTPLMDAANVGFTDIVRILLEYNADTDVRSSTNNTALHYAACGGYLDCCKLLLEYSSSRQSLIEEQNENGHTALMEAATSGFLEVTKFLIENGALINTPSAEFKETALTLASYKGYSDIVQFLLEAGADHEHRTDEMHTALMEASMEGHIDTARVLLDYGAQVNMRADSFESPLTLAACSGHTDLAALLISFGADIEEVNDESYTPLMEAAREGHLETVVMLLAMGAKINWVTEETQETAMTLAACGGFLEIVMLLHRCGAEIELGASTPLMESAQEGHLDIVKSLVCMGANIEAKNASDETSLHFAAENGHVEVCRYLLDCNANINHTSEGGRTAIMKASRAGNLEVVELLVERGAKIDQLTTQGDHNALSLACANGNCKVVEYLLKVGADPTIKLKDNCTVLIEASRGGHIDVIEILLRDNKRNRKLPMPASLINSQSQQYLGNLSNLDIDLNQIQQIDNQYMKTIDKNSFNVGVESSDSKNKFLSIPVGMRLQNTSNSICSDSSSIFNENQVHSQSNQDISQFPTCSFNNPLYPSKSCFNLQMINDVVSSDFSNEKFIRPLFLPNEIPDPPSNPPPLPPLRNYEKDDKSLLSLNTTNDINLQMLHMLDSNSPNLEEWMKYVCSNFTKNPYSTDNHYEIATPQLLQSFPVNNQPNRKIKKAKHSDNYNSQIDIQNYQFNCSQQLCGSNAVEKAFPEDISDSVNYNVHRCPAEGADSTNHSLSNNIDCQKNLNFSDQLKNYDDFSLSCIDCIKFNGNFSKTSVPQIQQKNIFSSSTNCISNTHVTPSSTPLTDSGIFSSDKNNTNSSNSSSQSHDDFQTNDIKRYSTSVTPTTISPIKPKTNNQASSTPFQKQVLQPKRRLQQNQRSPLSTVCSVSVSSMGPDFKTTPTSSIQSDAYLLSTAASQLIFDSNLCSVQDATIPNNVNPNFNFTDKNSNIATEDKGAIFLHATLNEAHKSNHSNEALANTTISSSHVCHLAHSCNNKHEFLSPNYHLEFMPKINIDNCETMPIRKSNIIVSDNNCNVENLEAVEEMENEENDDPEYESDIELENCIVPPYNKPSSSVTHDGCNKHNMNNITNNNTNNKKRLNVNVCTESLQESPLSLACSGGHIEVVKLLINSGAKLEHRDKKSQTPLHVSVLNGHLEVVKFLLDSSADIEAMVERTKDTALSLACANGKLEIVEELVIRNAMIEHRNISDYTPLCLAASGGYVDIIKFLLKKGSEINSRTNSKLGISPLMLASMNGHVEAVRVLLENGSDINAQIETNRNTALTLACFQGRGEVVSLLIERRANIEHRAKSGLTPLMEAASQGHVEVGRILLNAGAEVNATPVPATRETALIIAADKGHTKFVDLLLLNGAVVDARNKKGDTPLWLACTGGYIDVVKLLIDYRADVNSSDNRKMTCLMSAFKKGHVDVVEELVKYVTQFPSEHDCNKHLKSVKDGEKDLIKKCETCKGIILKAKERQEFEAAKNAKDLLKQVEEEKKAKEQKEVKQAKKREKKKAKKKAKQEEKEIDIPRSDVKNDNSITILPMKESEEIVREFPDESDFLLIGNNENINPNVPVSLANHAKIRDDNEKNIGKSGGDQKSSNDLINGVVLKNKKDEPHSNNLNLSSKVLLNTSNDSNEIQQSRLNSKNNAWIQINSSKNNSAKTDENVHANWQKIGSSKKKLDIPVNKKDIGKVIGQGGSVVNAIRHISGAHIDIDSNANEFDERIVHLKGTPEAVSKAKDFICDLVEGKVSGSDVIQESEPYSSKSSNQKTVHDTSPNSSFDVEYTKTPNKPLPIIRYNGKVNSKVSGYNKFGLSAVSTNNSNNNSLQYGFSKSVKCSADFATVAAAGIVSVGSQYHSKLKHPDKIFHNGIYSTSQFPSLSEANQNSTPVSNINNNNIAVDNCSKSILSLTDRQLSENNHILQQAKNISSEHIPSFAMKEPLEVKTTSITTQKSPFGQQQQSQPPASSTSKSFPLAPGSERSMHQRTYNSTPEHSPQMENTNSSSSSKYNNVDNQSNFSTDKNSTDSMINSNISDFGGEPNNSSTTNIMNLSHSGNGNIWPPSSNNNNSSNSGTTEHLLEYNRSFINPSTNLVIGSSKMNVNASSSAIIAPDYEVLNQYPKLQNLNPKAEAFSPITKNIFSAVKTADDLFYSGTTTAAGGSATANVMKSRPTGIGIQNMIGLSNNQIVVPSAITPGSCSSNNICNNKTDQSVNASNFSGQSKKSIQPVYSMNQSSTIGGAGVAQLSNIPSFSIKNPNAFQPPSEPMIRLQDHINNAKTILLQTYGNDHNMAEAAFSSFMRSANVDLNALLTSSEFMELINNIVNQSTTTSGHQSQPTPSSIITPNPHNIPHTISFVPPNAPAPNDPINYSVTTNMVNPNDSISRLFTTNHNHQPPPNFRHQQLILNQIPSVTPAAQTHWSVINNINTQSIWAASGSTNPLASQINTPFFSNLGQCAQAAFNSSLSFSPQQQQTALSISSLSNNNNPIDSSSSSQYVVADRVVPMNNQSQKVVDPCTGVGKSVNLSSKACSGGSPIHESSNNNNNSNNNNMFEKKDL